MILCGEHTWVLPVEFVDIICYWMKTVVKVGNAPKVLGNYLQEQRGKRKKLIREYLEPRYARHALYRWCFWNDEHLLHAFNEPMPIWSSNTNEERDNYLLKFKHHIDVAVKHRIQVSQP